MNRFAAFPISGNRIAAIILSLGFLLFSFSSCKPDKVDDSNRSAIDYPADVALEWSNMLMTVERYAFERGFMPPVAARASAYIHLAAYEAGGAGTPVGMPNHNSLRDIFPVYNLPKLDETQRYHWPTAVNAAYYTMYDKFFGGITLPSQLTFGPANLEKKYIDKYRPNLLPEVYERSRAWGKAVAEAVWEWSKSDYIGYRANDNNYPANFIYQGGPFLWEPSPTTTIKTPLLPQWGDAHRFVATTNDTAGGLPPTYYIGDFNNYSGSEYAIQAMEVYNQVAEIRKNSTRGQELRWIAEFWSDDIPGLTFTPSGRWFMIANQVIEQKKSSITLDRALECFARLGVALNDAGVVCWHLKYKYDTERPVTYLRRNIDRTWLPHLRNPLTGTDGVTPGFPAYPSGHSTFGAAAAEVLAGMFGDNITVTDQCHKDRVEFRGIPRTFSSFRDMALENAYSRIPLGVHFRMDCDEGLRIGKKVGRKVVETPFSKF